MNKILFHVYLQAFGVIRVKKLEFGSTWNSVLSSMKNMNNSDSS